MLIYLSIHEIHKMNKKILIIGEKKRQVMAMSHFSDSIAEFTLQDPLQSLQLLRRNLPCPLKLIQKFNGSVDIYKEQHVQHVHRFQVSTTIVFISPITVQIRNSTLISYDLSHKIPTKWFPFLQKPLLNSHKD